MEVFLYNSTVCRLCGEENDNGTLLYSCEENSPNLSEVINTYLPIKVYDDGQLPRTICPGCTIQLEATVEFLTLIINGQKVIRELHLREREYKKTILNPAPEQDVITEKIVYEVNTNNGVYQVEHPIALQVAGLEKPKRKRGRPPKKHKSPEELAQEAAAKEKELKSVKKIDREDEPTGKRRRKTPTRFKEAVQGKELERIFKEEGVTDGEDSDREIKPDPDIDVKVPVSKEPEIIGHMENSGELVVFVKGKGRGRPKGPMRLTRKECAICGMEFSCAGRYMSHVAQHGPVIYQCGQCNETFDTQLNFTNHQKEMEHTGKNVIPIGKKNAQKMQNHNIADIIKIEPPAVSPQPIPETPEVAVNTLVDNVIPSLPDLTPKPPDVPAGRSPAGKSPAGQSPPGQSPAGQLAACPSPAGQSPVGQSDSPTIEIMSSPSVINVTDSPVPTKDSSPQKPVAVEQSEPTPAGKVRLKCNHCDKTFSNKQSKSLHIKAAHVGERPYVCVECGARFAYPRSLALHAVSHRRHRTNYNKGFACDLCGKVLNHPSSVVYHKEAEHAGQRYVCNKCGKSFKHKQLLQRHQLVHSQVRPYTCKTCNASFKTKANLLNHQLLHTGVKKFSCEICKHKFAHKTSLTLHMRWHTGQKPFSCGTCGKSFSQKGNLSEHARIHTGEKPFQCELCPRRFTTSSQHRLHARRHATDRPYACATCGKRFQSRSAWSAHVRRAGAHGAGPHGAGPHGAGAGPHGAGARLKCAWCPRTFLERWSLVKHARTHDAERPFRCPHCPRAFADCSNLNKHKKQVHKQMSLLTNSQPPAPPAAPPQPVPPPSPSPVDVKLSVEECEDSLEERVIYVTYDVDEPDEPAFHILSPEQAASLEESKVLTTCELYSGPSLLVPQPELEEMELEPEPLEQEELEQLVLDGHEHMPVTDEQGNPLHFTMQDGTRLAITSADGKSLQVITQDGQTIPVEINGYADEEEVDNPDTIVHQLNLQKSVDNNVSAPVTHYFTIV